MRTNFEDHGKILSTHVVVGLDKDLSQAALTDRVVLGIEFVEPMKRVTILKITITVSQKN